MDMTIEEMNVKITELDQKIKGIKTGQINCCSKELETIETLIIELSTTQKLYYDYSTLLAFPELNNFSKEEIRQIKETILPILQTQIDTIKTQVDEYITSLA